MEPNVCGKLLTTHWRGYGVDVEALRDDGPLPAELRNRPQDGISWIQKVAAVELGFRGAPGCFQGMRVYKGEGSTSVEQQGAHEAGRSPTPRGRAGHPRGRLVCCLTSTPSLLDCVCSKRISPEGFIPFGLRLIFLFCETLK